MIFSGTKKKRTQDSIMRPIHNFLLRRHFSGVKVLQALQKATLWKTLINFHALWDRCGNLSRDRGSLTWILFSPKSEERSPRCANEIGRESKEFMPKSRLRDLWSAPPPSKQILKPNWKSLSGAFRGEVLLKVRRYLTPPTIPKPLSKP